MSTQTFFLLSDIDLPVTVKIGILENVFLNSDVQSAAEVYNHRLKNGFLGMESRSNEVPFFISAQLFSSGHPLGPPAYTTLLSAPTSQPLSPLSPNKPKPLVVDQWLNFIARYKDLSPSSTICLIIHKLSTSPLSITTPFPVTLPLAHTSTANVSSDGSLLETPPWLDPSIKATPVMAVSMPLFNKSGKIKQHSRILKFSDYFPGFALNPPSYKPFASTPLGVSHNLPTFQNNDTNSTTDPSTATSASFSFFAPSRPTTSSLARLIREPPLLGPASTVNTTFSAAGVPQTSTASNNDWLSALSVKTLPHLLTAAPLPQRLTPAPTATITLSPFSHPVIFAQPHTTLPATVVCAPPSVSGRTFGIDDVSATLPSCTLVYEYQKVPPRHVQMLLKQTIVRVLTSKVNFEYTINTNVLTPAFFASGKGSAGKSGFGNISTITPISESGVEASNTNENPNNANPVNDNSVVNNITTNPASPTPDGNAANTNTATAAASTTSPLSPTTTGASTKTTMVPKKRNIASPTLTVPAANANSNKNKHPFTFYQSLLTAEEKSWILQWPEWLMEQKSGWLLFSLCVDWESEQNGPQKDNPARNTKIPDGSNLPGASNPMNTANPRKPVNTSNSNATDTNSIPPYTAEDAFHLFSHARKASVAECVWALWYGLPLMQYYASNLLWRCTENELVLYLLQLLQCLRRGVVHNIRPNDVLGLGTNGGFGGMSTLDTSALSPMSSGSGISTSEKDRLTPEFSFSGKISLPAPSGPNMYTNNHLHTSHFPSAESLRSHRAYLNILTQIVAELQDKGISVCKCVEIAGYKDVLKSLPNNPTSSSQKSPQLPLSALTARNCKKCPICSLDRITINDDDISASLATISMTIPAIPQTCVTPPQHYYPHLAAFSPLIQVLITKACCHEKICTKMYWMLSTEIDGSRIPTTNNNSNANVSTAPGYGAVDGVGAMFIFVRDLLLDTLSVTPHGRRWRRSLLDQKKLLERTVELYQHPALSVASVDQKIGALRQLLSDTSSASPFEDLITFSRPISLPLLPDAKVVGMVGSKCSMFKSAKRPILATYVLAPPMPMVGDGYSSQMSTSGMDATTPENEMKQNSQSSLSGNSAACAKVCGKSPLFGLEKPWYDSCDPHAGFQDITQNTVAKDPESSNGQSNSNAVANGPTEYRAIFKCGDDLRQDQLICNLFRLFDMCNLRYGLNANVTNYNVVATSASTGWVELIGGCVTLENIVHDYNRSIKEYLVKSKVSDKALNTAMQRLLRSSAAYCMMSFFLEIGDRHMENILVCKDGHLAHIDFGYIFGKDPKLWQPRIKLTSEMVNAMGGEKSSGYVHFLEYCSEFTWILRKQAMEYKWLVDVMAGAGLESYTEKNDTGYNVMMLIGNPLNKCDEEEAEDSIVQLMASSHRAVMGLLNDKIHTFAVSMK